MRVVTRCIEGGSWKHNYYLANADPSPPAAELAPVAKAEHRVEE
jgi:hypothetical protein